MTQPTFAIAVTFEIQPEFVHQFRDRILQQASDSLRIEPGCCQFDVLTNESDPSVFFLYETYVDADAFVAHKETEHFKDFDQTVSAWITAKQVRRLTMLEKTT